MQNKYFPLLFTTKSVKIETEFPPKVTSFHFSRKYHCLFLLFGRLWPFIRSSSRIESRILLVSSRHSPVVPEYCPGTPPSVLPKALASWYHVHAPRWSTRRPDVRCSACRARTCRTQPECCGIASNWSRQSSCQYSWSTGWTHSGKSSSPSGRTPSCRPWQPCPPWCISSDHSPLSGIACIHYWLVHNIFLNERSQRSK